MKLVFATNNKNKFEEIRHKIGDIVQLINLNDLGFNEEIPETHMTLGENAAEKAFFIFERFKLNCFADDTGLEIKALSGNPGVFLQDMQVMNPVLRKTSKRVLKELRGIRNREAQFRTVIALVENGKLITFEGRIRGKILEERKGSKGFGYDSIFRPDGFDKTFAEMSLKKKYNFSQNSRGYQAG